MKIFNPFSLYRRVSFDYYGSIEAGIYQLSKFVAKPVLQLKLNDGLIGEISTEKVEIRLHRPFSKNFLIPVFIGRFVNDKGKTELTGDFRLHKYTKKTFTLLMLGIIVFWIYVAIADHNQLSVQSKVMAPLWFCLGTLLFMVVALFLCRPIANKDMENIEQQIREILTVGHI